MTRRSISTRERVRIFETWGGVCHLCGGKIAAGEAWDADHALPLALGGEDGGDNLRPAHARCHKAKTASDVSRIRKADRQRAAHIGAKAQSRTPLPFGRKSAWKRKVTGEIVPR